LDAQAGRGTAAAGLPAGPPERTLRRIREGLN
jgi:hypothetical protein